MCYLRVWMLLFAGLWVLTAYSQKYELESLTVADGLPHSLVTCIVEDSLGYLWIGMEGGGLARFDGIEFVTYTVNDGLLSNFVDGLYLDDNHVLWVVQESGLSKFDRNKFTNYTLRTPMHGVNYHDRSQLFYQGDTLIFLTRTYACLKLVNDSVVFERPQATSGVEARQIETYIREKALMELRNQYALNDSIRDWINHVVAHRADMTVSRFGSCWVISDEDQVYVVDRGLHRHPRNPTEHVIYYDPLHFETWSVTLPVGVVVRNVLTHHVREIIHPLITETQINTVLHDREGNIWIGTVGRGLLKYFTPTFIKYDHQASGNDIIMSIEEDANGAIVVGTINQGIKVYNRRHQLIKHIRFNEVSRNQVRSIKKDIDGSLWVGTYGGLGKLNKDYQVLEWWDESNSLPFERINAITLLGNGRLCLSTRGGGVILYDSGLFYQFLVSDGLGSSIVWTGINDPANDRVIFATANGVYYLKNNIIHKMISCPDSLGAVLSMQLTDDKLILGTLSQGIFIINEAQECVRQLSKKEGLISNLVYIVYQDSAKNIWAGTENGIDRIQFNDSTNTLYTITHYNVRSGTHGVETNINALKVTRMGEILFGTIDGLYLLNLSEELPVVNLKPHFVRIDNPVTGSGFLPYAEWAGGLFNIPYGLTLPYSVNHIRFEFNAVSKSNVLVYSYKLAGFDPIWSDPSRDRVITYYNLKPGKYTLMVADAKNKTLLLTYPFEILPPLYTQPSFIIIITIFLLAIIGFLIYKRIQHKVRMVLAEEKIRQEQQYLIRQELSRDFHDEMGTYLSRIITFVSLMRMQLNGHSNTGPLLEKIEAAAKHLHKGTRDFIWASNPANDQSEKLFWQLVEFGQSLFNMEFHYFRSYYTCDTNYYLPTGFNRQIMLIFKEVMNNAFKHSGGKNFTWRAFLENDHLVFQFKDDGSGLETIDLHSGSGLLNMRVRAAKIGANIQITTNDSGTTVTLHLSLNQLTNLIGNDKKKNHNH